MKLQNSNGAINARRIKTLQRLEKQLNLGVKQPKGSFLTLDMVLLEEEDIIRIKKEIAVLRDKIISSDSARMLRTKKYRAAH